MVNGLRKIVFLVLALCSLLVVPARAQEARNRPYVDDKLFHFGFHLGMNFTSFGITDSEMPITDPLTGVTEIYHARVSGVTPGFHVGFVTDLRLCKYLNLRFCPEITYRIGFANQLANKDGRMELPPQDFFYTDAISRMTNHCVSLTFNFE